MVYSQQNNVIISPFFVKGIGHRSLVIGHLRENPKGIFPVTSDC